VQTLRYEMLLTADTPIAHHSESIGNQAIFQRRKVRLPDGSFESVATINADTMRHGLREASAYAFLDAAGLLDAEALTRAALRLLFSGGMVTGRGDAGQVSLDRFREMVELCPPLALLGGCSDSRVIPGRLFVEDAVLVCEEQRAYLPEWVIERSPPLDTCRAFVEEQTRVRMDPLLSPAKRALLATGEQIEAIGQLAAGEAAHESDDAVERSAAKSTMLPRSFETVVQGAQFSWCVTAQCMNDLDIDTLHMMLAGFLYRPVVGGKKGTGHGRLRLTTWCNVPVTRARDAATEVALGPKMGELFRSHVAERRERIRAWLATVDA
jgi:hypothetical protein